MGGVLVTGAFGALGRAIVAELGERGIDVAAVDAAAVPADLTAPSVIGGIDLNDEDATDACFRQAAAAVGGLDGLVNAAGGFIWEPIVGGSVASWHSMYRINLHTAVNSTRAALSYLLDSGGAIVNIGAAGASNPGVGMASYAASKAGICALTESLANELREVGVRVNAILPTILDTPKNRADMPEADRSGWVKPRSAARVIAFLLSAEAASVTGASIPVSLPG